MENNQENSGKYSDSSGTGVLSSIIFTIIALVIMFLLAKFLG